ncbi:unnamed protein product [Prorocentrum cordatum]|uniref:Uncharacterized protein n=1 Tax=Prorocentrum cordatum TaxID=2364126 RepID=A0ABN9U7N7_9DINO|nr:unnamed protein product [Polarella glacialis]
MVDEVLTGFSEYFGHVRDAGEALWANPRDAREGRRGLEAATMKVLGWSTARQASASLFVHGDDAAILMRPHVQRELQVPLPGETDDRGPRCTSSPAPPAAARPLRALARAAA